MKEKTYQSPWLEEVKFNDSDIVTISGDPDVPPETDGYWSGIYSWR